MSEKVFLSVIIPAYNEAKRLPATVKKCALFLALQPYISELIVVENGSQDNTFALAQELSQRLSKANVLVKAIKDEGRGKGRAVRSGMLEATGEYRFMADADLSMPIEEVTRFLPPALSGYDVAIGSREASDAVRHNEPTYRHLGGRVMNSIIRLLALPGLQDTQCGFKCFRDAAAEELFSKQTQMGWAFDVEILYLARKMNYTIVEVPINWYYNPESKLNLIRDALQMIKDIYSIRNNAA